MFVWMNGRREYVFMKNHVDELIYKLLRVWLISEHIDWWGMYDVTMINGWIWFKDALIDGWMIMFKL